MVLKLFSTAGDDEALVFDRRSEPCSPTGRGVRRIRHEGQHFHRRRPPAERPAPAAGLAAGDFARNPLGAAEIRRPTWRWASLDASARLGLRRCRRAAVRLAEIAAGARSARSRPWSRPSPTASAMQRLFELDSGR